MYSFCIASGFKLSLITPFLSILYTSTKLQRGRVTVIRLSVFTVHVARDGSCTSARVVRDLVLLCALLFRQIIQF